MKRKRVALFCSTPDTTTPSHDPLYPNSLPCQSFHVFFIKPLYVFVTQTSLVPPEFSPADKRVRSMSCRAVSQIVKFREKAPQHARVGGAVRSRRIDRRYTHQRNIYMYIFSNKHNHGARREACRHLERRRCQRLQATSWLHTPEFERPRPSLRALKENLIRYSF
jgi:hypothetical protein